MLLGVPFNKEHDLARLHIWWNRLFVVLVGSTLTVYVTPHMSMSLYVGEEKHSIYAGAAMPLCADGGL